MSSKRLVLALLALIVAGAWLPARAAAATYYVAPTGSDSNPGTQASPFGTIQHAADIVNPGDTVLVADGTYTSTPGNACGSAVVCLTRGGTGSAWVTFRSINPQGAKISGQSNSVKYGFEFQAAANYVTIEGFDVFGMGNASGDASGFVIYNGGHDVVIAHNDIHDVGRLCTDTTNGETGIFLANANVTVDSNRIHDIGRFAPGENGCQPSGNQYTNHDHGVYVDGNSTAAGANNTTIVNNVFSNNARGWSIQVYPGSIANLSVLNNTFSGPNPYSEGHIIMGASTTNGRIANNIFDNPNAAGINFYQGTHSNLVVSNNLSSLAISTSTPGGVSFTNNVQNADPQLNSSFQPSSQSLAVDGGLAITAVSGDIDGTHRPQGSGWDIGAYEVGGAPASAPAPAPAPAATPAPASSGDCTSIKPGADWTCYNGGWLPPGYPIPSAPVATSATPASSAPVVSSTPCTTTRPGLDWTCYNGNWLPPGYPIPSGVTASVPSAAPTASTPVGSSAACTTIRPGLDWTCYNGGWLPPGYPIPSGATGVVTSAPSTDSKPCPGSDPFVAIGGGVCIAGDWRPKNMY